MAPIKFEENIKDKLEERSLKPSTEAWATLASRLDAKEKKNNSKKFWWLGIAASIVGVIFITTQIFQNSTVDSALPVIVKSDSEVQTGENKTLEEQHIVDDVQLTTTNPTKAVQEVEATNAVVAEKAHKEAVLQNTVINSHEKAQDYAVVDKAPVIKTPKVESAVVNELPYETIKLNEVVAQIKTMSENRVVTEEDLNALLQQAEKEILAKKIYNESTKVVDANALLQDVEADLDQSFRDRVFKSLKSSYYVVKTAVADRNN